MWLVRADSPSTRCSSLTRRTADALEPDRPLLASRGPARAGGGDLAGCHGIQLRRPASARRAVFWAGGAGPCFSSRGGNHPMLRSQVATLTVLAGAGLTPALYKAVATAVTPARWATSSSDFCLSCRAAGTAL